jgi:hypothetical protein
MGWKDVSAPRPFRKLDSKEYAGPDFNWNNRKEQDYQENVHYFKRAQAVVGWVKRTDEQDHDEMAHKKNNKKKADHVAMDDDEHESPARNKDKNKNLQDVSNNGSKESASNKKRARKIKTPRTRTTTTTTTTAATRPMLRMPNPNSCMASHPRSPSRTTRAAKTKTTPCILEIFDDFLACDDDRLHRLPRNCSLRFLLVAARLLGS